MQSACSDGDPPEGRRSPQGGCAFLGYRVGFPGAAGDSGCSACSGGVSARRLPSTANRQTSAMEAARPENRQRALAALDQDVLASSTLSSNSCRVRLYESVCRMWGVEPWPLSRESIRAFGACLKAGAYKSVAVYYSALASHQLRTMWQAPSPELPRCIQDTRRAVLRGAGPSRLKDHFHVPVLRQVLRWDAEPAPFDGQDPHHMAEVLLLSSCGGCCAKSKHLMHRWATSPSTKSLGR